MLFMLSSISPFISAQRWGYRWIACIEEEPHPRPLPEEGGEWLAMEMEEVIWGLIGGGDVVDNEG